MCFIAFILKTTGSCKFFLYLQDPVITEPCIFIALGSEPNAIKDFFPVNTGVFLYLQEKNTEPNAIKYFFPVFTRRIYRQNLQENFSCNYRVFPVKQNFIDNRHVFLWLRGANG